MNRLILLFHCDEIALHINQSKTHLYITLLGLDVTQWSSANLAWVQVTNSASYLRWICLIFCIVRRGFPFKTSHWFDLTLFSVIWFALSLSVEICTKLFLSLWLTFILITDYTASLSAKRGNCHRNLAQWTSSHGSLILSCGISEPAIWRLRVLLQEHSDLIPSVFGLSSIKVNYLWWPK